MLISRKAILVAIVAVAQLNVLAQIAVRWQSLPNLPMAVCNNAVAVAVVADTPFVFSFGGMDTSKQYAGITQRSFRYNTISKKWKEIRPLPDVLGKIACAASAIKNKLYIVGGYHVLPDGKEISSSRVHVYDPVTNTYTEGAPVTGGIDDQVQAVWRDSLLYIISGWSQNGNVSAVQVYNPATNAWQPATPVPETKQYKVFGGSGVIIGDTIFCSGGAYYDKHYPLGAIWRKGVIDPEDPAKIEWTNYEDSLALGYRMAAIVVNGMACWIGGSAVSYNYNGVAYNGSGGVPALSRLIWHRAGALHSIAGQLPSVMDMRGAAAVGKNHCVIAGGMLNGQKVSDKVYLITIANRK